MASRLRKHYVALIALGAFHFVFFFPLAFMGRVVSPNDVFFNYEPWGTYRPASVARIQNDLMNDPPTAYLPLMSLVKSDWRAFHWNPYVGGGIPGFGSSASAVLSPFVFFPSLTVPLSWVYTAIIFLKINVAFLFAYFWLREEGMGKRASAIGAIIIAGAGVYSVRWLWQITNATALYPALLWVIRRAFNGKRTPVWAIALIALGYALAGFPSAMAYGAYMAVLYFVFLAIRLRRFPVMRIGEASLAVLLAFFIAAPSIVPFAQFLRRSGYLEMRSNASANTFPLAHWRSFVDPQRLGNPALKNWIGDPSLGPLNNYFEATIYVGIIALPLCALALFRRGQMRWFWVVFAVLVLCCMFGISALPKYVARAPGFRYTSLSRTSLLLPIAAGFLSAAGAAFLLRRFRGRYRTAGRILAGTIAAAAAVDLAAFAGVFHPFLQPRDTNVPVTPVIDRLRSDPAPFRFVAFLTYLWPNSAELYGVEDLASHFGSEAAYRRLLRRIDPTSWSGTNTVVQFNSLRFNFSDPFVSMLGVRYFLEHRPIDIIKWTTFAATTAGVTQDGAFVLTPRTLAERTVSVDAEPFWAIELPVSVETVIGASPRLDVELLKNGATLWSRSFIPADIQAMNKIYVPLRPYARQGERVTLRLWSTGMRVGLLRGDAPPGESPIFYGRVTIPLIFDRELPDGRVFRNLAEVPRFNPVKRVRKLNDDEFISVRDIDFAEEAVITDDPVFPPDAIAQDARVKLSHYEPAEQRMQTTASGPFFLASSEKLTPELRVFVDGRRVSPIRTNLMFAGINVPAGTHEVVFQRRIGRGWWVLAGLAVLVLGIVAAFELTSARRRR